MSHRITAIAAAAVACLTLAAGAEARTPSSVVTLKTGDELVPCKQGGRVLAIRELATGLPLVRETRPPLYLRRVNPLMDAVRDWELDRRDVSDRGGVRYFAHTRNGELLNATSATIRVRVRCDETHA